MTTPVIVLITIGIIFVVISFILSERASQSEEESARDMMVIPEDYTFSERELQIIKSKVEDEIAEQAKTILYETNDSLSNMANEKTMALGDYAVTVCEEIERNHKEVMFLYSMLEDKQKEIISTVTKVNTAKEELKEVFAETDRIQALYEDIKDKHDLIQSIPEKVNDPNIPPNSALEQLSIMTHNKKVVDVIQTHQKNEEANHAEINNASETFINNETESVDYTENEMELAEVDVVPEEVFDEQLDKEFEQNENSNELILSMYGKGCSILDIAKELGLGVGEVRLVIDLYQGE